MENIEQQTLEQMMGWDVPEPEIEGIKFHWDVAQHSDKWYELRCGKITASVMKNLIKKKTDRKTGEVTYSVPDNDTTKAYLFELAAQRVTGDIGDNFQSYDMERGLLDEVEAFNLYSEKYRPLRNCGFVENTQHGVLIGYSPDGLTVDGKGGIECKGRKPKFQAETLYNMEVPDEFIIQIQTGLLVTKRETIDFIQYCGGMNMVVIPVKPDPVIQDVIILAAQEAEKKVCEIVDRIEQNIKIHGFHPTKKRLEDIRA